jgi:hypothetical protein
MNFPAMDAFIDIFAILSKDAWTRPEARLVQAFRKIGAIQFCAQGPGTMNAGYAAEVDMRPPGIRRALISEEAAYQRDNAGIPGMYFCSLPMADAMDRYLAAVPQF